MKAPLVSAVMPNRNYAEFLPQAIESVRAQSFSDWELVIVDDCSDDASREVIASFAERDARIRLVKLARRRGPREARNVGVLEARGRYIAFLDSDDFWAPQKLQAQLDFMRRCGAVISGASYEEIRGEDAPRRRFAIPFRTAHRQMLLRNVLNTCTVVYDRRALGSRLNLHPIAQDDYSLWLDILREGHALYGLDETLAWYRIHKGSRSSNKFEILLQRLTAYRRVERMSWPRALWHSFLYAVIAVWRRKLQPRLSGAQS